MFGSGVLDIAIGAMFLYLFLSLICTVLNEAIASIMNKRGKNLFEGVKNLLNDPTFTGLAQQLYSHGLVDGISRNAADPNKPNRPPSYMPAETFALSLLDILAAGGVAARVDTYEATVQTRQAELNAATAKRDAVNPADDPVTYATLNVAVQAAQSALTTAQAALVKAQEAATKQTDAQTKAEQVKKGLSDPNLAAASAALAAALSAGRELAALHPAPLDNICAGIAKLPDGHTKESLMVLVDKTRREMTAVANEVGLAERTVARLQKNVEDWFNGAMDRVGGWYKRWTQLVLLLLALLTVGMTNADTLVFVKHLARDTALRTALVTAADKVVQSAPATKEAAGETTATDSDAVRKSLLLQAEKVNLPLGWVRAEDDPYRLEQVPDNPKGWPMKIFGLLLTVAMVSLGAPFWFDTLNKFVNLRGAGTPPGEPKRSAPAVSS